MAGEYRTATVIAQLPPAIGAMIQDGLRIALANQPMINVTEHPELAAELATAYASIGLTRYAEGLRTGAMIPVKPRRTERYYSPGELFFAS